MSTTIDTFIYLKRDIEQSFQRLQTIFNSTYYDQKELDQLFNHISCTLDDLDKVNQLLHSSSTLEHTHPLAQNENSTLYSNKRYKEHEQPLLSSSSNPDPIDDDDNERANFIEHMKEQLNYYKTRKDQLRKKENPMEIIQLDQENEDQMLRKQDEQLEDFHLSIVSLKNLTQNINLEINDHIRVLDNLDTTMIDQQNHVGNLTTRTKHFLRISSDGIGGHTCLFSIAVILFFLIVILILFF